jgi:hypothetical protein
MKMPPRPKSRLNGTNLQKSITLTQIDKQTLKIFSRGASQHTISSATQRPNKLTIVRGAVASVTHTMIRKQVNSNKSIEEKYTRMTADTITQRSKVLTRNSRLIEPTNKRKQDEIPRAMSHPLVMLRFLHTWYWVSLVYSYF